MTTAPRATSSTLTTGRFGAGLLFLLLSLGASLVLAAGHLNVMEAPGCGGGSPCDRAAASVFGKLPLIGWPLSLFGLAWFSALIAAWTAAFLGSGTSAAFRNLVRLGAAGSAVYVTAMIVGGYLCPYCIAVHVGGIGFLFVCEGTRSMRGRRLVLAGWGAAAFVLVTLIELRADAAVQARIEAQLADSTQRMIEASQESTVPVAGPLSGRHRRGPELAPIRIVVFSDYACPTCKIVEAEVAQILEERDDVSLTAKHFPMCVDCNRHTSSTLHEHACEEARAAETVGQLYGEEAFWEVHSWLFGQEDHYEEAQLFVFLEASGYDTSEFSAALTREEPLEFVKQDVEDAHALGIFYTPLVYINGVELKGAGSSGLIRRAVETLAATSPPALAAAEDVALSANEKHIADWAANPFRDLSQAPQTWALGPEDAAVEIVVWGDYLTDLNAQANEAVWEVLGTRDDVRYVFRHFPLHSGCNPISEVIIEPETCNAHRAAEAAGRLHGQDGYWQMHEWLISTREEFNTQLLREAAPSMGFMAEELAAKVNSEEVAQAIRVDCAIAGSLGVRAVPTVLVNGRQVPAWNQKGMLEVIVAEAAARVERGEDQPVSKPSGPIQIEVPPGSFTGRYRLGPEKAPIRIVLFADYGSSTCRKLAVEARRLAQTREDVSLSPKHYPLNPSCNPHAVNEQYANACVAAQVTEAFGMAYGNEAFWEVDSWMYEEAPSLDLTGLTELIEGRGRTRGSFSAALRNPELLGRIQQDVQEARDLGIERVPRVFINGQERREIITADALRVAVEKLAATSPPALDATADRP